MSLIRNLGEQPPRIHFNAMGDQYKVVKFEHEANRAYPTVVAEGSITWADDMFVVVASDGLHYPVYTNNMPSAQAHAQAVEFHKAFTCNCCGDTGYLAYNTEMPCGWCEKGEANANFAVQIGER